MIRKPDSSPRRTDTVPQSERRISNGCDRHATSDENEPEWRQRAVSRSLTAARSRAEQRIQRFLDAAFELIDEKGTTEFTIQEVIDRSKQSLRGFYQYFDGKDELILALFEETVRESIEDLRAGARGRHRSARSVAGVRRPAPRVVRPAGAQAGHATTGARSRSSRPARGRSTPTGSTPRSAPIYRMMLDLIEAADAAGVIHRRRHPPGGVARAAGRDVQLVRQPHRAQPPPEDRLRSHLGVLPPRPPRPVLTSGSRCSLTRASGVRSRRPAPGRSLRSLTCGRGRACGWRCRGRPCSAARR